MPGPLCAKTFSGIGDIHTRLGLKEPRVVITGFDRTNLLYESRRMNKASDKSPELLKLIRQEPGLAGAREASRRPPAPAAR